MGPRTFYTGVLGRQINRDLDKQLKYRTYGLPWGQDHGQLRSLGCVQLPEEEAEAEKHQ